MDRDILHPTL